MEHIYEIVLDGAKLNDCIRGRISGIMCMLVRKPDKSFAWRNRYRDDRWIVTTKCSEDTFKEIIETVNHAYPDVIVKTHDLG